MTLQRTNPKTPLCTNLEIANNLKKRLVGLIGTKDMNDKALWIPQCNWIHTFFMSIPIDVIYIDKTMTIKKIDHSLRPWRLPRPVFSATSVIEAEAGLAEKMQLKIGEKLDVGH